jgi:hypothetical protein
MHRFRSLVPFKLLLSVERGEGPAELFCMGLKGWEMLVVCPSQGGARAFDGEPGEEGALCSRLELSFLSCWAGGDRAWQDRVVAQMISSHCPHWDLVGWLG